MLKLNRQTIIYQIKKFVQIVTIGNNINTKDLHNKYKMEVSVQYLGI